MTHAAPPRWAEFLLERVLRERDRQAVTGDLREEYAAVVSRRARWRADLWYCAQVVSLGYWRVKEGRAMKAALMGFSGLGVLCGCWLAFMEMVLRHPGYGARAAVDAVIAAIGAATLLALVVRVGVIAERVLWAGAAFLVWIAVEAFLRNERAAHFEGFVVVIATVLVLQSALMLAVLGRRRSSIA